MTALFDTKLPIIQSPMAGVQDSNLAAAVCSAGGLGSLPCALLSLDELNAELSAMKQLTDKSYSANFFCHQLPPVDIDQEEKWRAELKPYFTEYGFNLDDIPEGPKREPFKNNCAMRWFGKIC